VSLPTVSDRGMNLGRRQGGLASGAYANALLQLAQLFD
jgi:hypothetical protein